MYFLNSKWIPLVFAAAILLVVNPNVAKVKPEPVPKPTSSVANQDDWLKQHLGNGLDVREQIASEVVAEQFVHQISAVEWLAPLAPVALSPFFGITLLSGLACYGPDWLPENALLSEGSPLANPTMFWVFLTLTVITSAPRFSKVSKPIAQLADFLETYSAIVILLVLKVVAMSETGEATDPDALVPVKAGIFAAGWEGLLMIAMAVNIVVVNTVKFFFEFLVWITPVPFLDACFEVANKCVCAGLMAIYAFSPLAALALNMVIFVACAFAFVWIKRREVFYRTMLFGWLIKSWNKLSGSKVLNDIPEELTVFPASAIEGIPAKARCLLLRKGERWQLHYKRLFRSSVVLEIDGPANLKPGWWTNSVDFGQNVHLTFSSQFNAQLPVLAEQMDFSVSRLETVEPDNLKVEFA